MTLSFIGEVTVRKARPAAAAAFLPFWSGDSSGASPPSVWSLPSSAAVSSGGGGTGVTPSIGNSLTSMKRREPGST